MGGIYFIFYFLQKRPTKDLSRLGLSGSLGAEATRDFSHSRLAIVVCD